MTGDAEDAPRDEGVTGSARSRRARTRDANRTAGAPHPPADTQDDGPSRHAPRVPDSSTPPDTDPDTDITPGDDHA